MRLLRGVIFPTIIAAPMWMQVLRIRFIGWSELGSLGWGDLLFGVFLTAVGLLLVGLPAASKVQRLDCSAPIKLILLLVTGVIGGGLIAILYPLLLGVLARSVDLDWFRNSLAIAAYGFVPGAIVAFVWIIFNLDKIRARSG